MTHEWLNGVEPTIANRTRVQQGPLAEAMSHLRTVIPAFDLVGVGTPEAAFLWSSQPVRLSEPLGTAFWDILTLADADVPDEQIVGFARRFGPLVWPDAMGIGEPTSTRQASDGQASLERRHAEPLVAWRQFARGLRALYDRLDPSRPKGVSGDEPEWAIAPIILPLGLKAGATAFPEELIPREATIVGMDFSPYDGVAPPDRLLEAALALAGVGAAFLPPSHRPPATGGLIYTLPAEAIDAPDLGAGRVWQVRGLLPMLIASLAFALHTQERPRCTWCGKPAAILVRVPRKGQPWYGDHKACRALARANTLNQSEDRRAEKRRARAARSTSSHAREEPATPAVTK